MTTKVTITCQENSHWDLKVTTQDRKYDKEAKKMTDEWVDTTSVVLGPGQSTQDQYVTDTRRFLVEEKVRN